MTIIVYEQGILMTDSKRVMNPGEWDAYGSLDDKIVNCGEFAYATCGGDIRKEYVPWLERALRATFFTYWMDVKVTYFRDNHTTDVASITKYRNVFRYWTNIYGSLIKFPPAKFDLIAMSRDSALHIKRETPDDPEKSWIITTDTKVLASSSLAYSIYRRAGQPPIEAIQSVIEHSELCCGPVHFARNEDLNDFEFEAFVDFLLEHEKLSIGEKE